MPARKARPKPSFKDIFLGNVKPTRAENKTFRNQLRDTAVWLTSRTKFHSAVKEHLRALGVNLEDESRKRRSALLDRNDLFELVTGRGSVRDYTRRVREKYADRPEVLSACDLVDTALLRIEELDAANHSARLEKTRIASNDRKRPTLEEYVSFMRAEGKSIAEAEKMRAITTLDIDVAMHFARELSDKSVVNSGDLKPDDADVNRIKNIVARRRKDAVNAGKLT